MKRITMLLLSACLSIFLGACVRQKAAEEWNCHSSDSHRSDFALPLHQIMLL